MKFGSWNSVQYYFADGHTVKAPPLGSVPLLLLAIVHMLGKFYYYYYCYKYL
jgi:hypothetical protein